MRFRWKGNHSVALSLRSKSTLLERHTCTLTCHTRSITCHASCLISISIGCHVSFVTPSPSQLLIRSSSISHTTIMGGVWITTKESLPKWKRAVYYVVRRKECNTTGKSILFAPSSWYFPYP
mmetsp:Transcript_14719/g.33375  ORF Transcript_14719/g.33375 Transcript_14719/m.33375 type:complete len:122 (+) Transcript_14719:179-544(+)